MSRVSKEQIEKAREMDLLTYLQTYEPDNLVRLGNNSYCTKEHDSLKISNGKWKWFSRDIGGVSALDYLVKVKEIPFPDAVLLLAGQAVERPPATVTQQKNEPRKPFILPKASYKADRVISYLEGRGIDRGIINYCLKKGMLYESYPRHNAVFVGFDGGGKAKYAFQRGCGSDFVGEVGGSDKHYSFNLKANRECGTLYVFESAIDLLSFATILKMEGYNWLSVNMLSLAGVYDPKNNKNDAEELPMALDQYLKDNPHIYNVITRLDNDETGRGAADAICRMLSERGIASGIREVPNGKDYNDCLCMQKGLPITHRAGHEKKGKNTRDAR